MCDLQVGYETAKKYDPAVPKVSQTVPLHEISHASRFPDVYLKVLGEYMEHTNAKRQAAAAGIENGQTRAEAAAKLIAFANASREKLVQLGNELKGYEQTEFADAASAMIANFNWVTEDIKFRLDIPEEQPPDQSLWAWRNSFQLQQWVNAAPNEVLTNGAPDYVNAMAGNVQSVWFEKVVMMRMENGLYSSIRLKELALLHQDWFVNPRDLPKTEADVIAFDGNVVTWSELKHTFRPLDTRAVDGKDKLIQFRRIIELGSRFRKPVNFRVYSTGGYTAEMRAALTEMGFKLYGRP